jgi:large subunit ribosomal protein L19
MAAKKSSKITSPIITAKEVKPGMQVKVYQKIKDVTSKGEEKERIQAFEGLVISRKHGNEIGATFTVRKVTEGVGVEKTYPIFSPLVDKVEVIDQKQVNRAKLYFVREPHRRLKSTAEKKAVTEKAAK